MELPKFGVADSDHVGKLGVMRKDIKEFAEFVGFAILTIILVTVYIWS